MTRGDCIADGTRSGIGAAFQQRSRWSSAIMRTSWSLGEILLLIAVVCFILAAIGLRVDVSLVDIGLACFAGSFLVGGRGLRVR
jgi:hypothetical protein